MLDSCVDVRDPVITEREGERKRKSFAFVAELKAGNQGV